MADGAGISVEPNVREGIRVYDGGLVRKLVYEISRNSKMIVVAGDVMTDVWLHGHYEPCQDRCSKFVVEDRYETPGGAANAANCLHHWHARVELYGAKWSRKTRLLGPLGRNVGGILSVPALSSILFRIDEDKRSPLSEWSRRGLLEVIPYAGACLISDYDKDTLSPILIREIIDSCSRHGVPCVADAKREPAIYSGCIIKCNNDYYNRYQEELIKFRPVVKTFGDMVPSVYANSLSRDIPVLPRVRCINHVGAGDCFAAHLALGLAYGLSLEEAATLAHSAGRVYVQGIHNSPPMPGDIMSDLDANNPPRIAHDALQAERTPVAGPSTE